MGYTKRKKEVKIFHIVNIKDVIYKKLIYNVYKNKYISEL